MTAIPELNSQPFVGHTVGCEASRVRLGRVGVTDLVLKLHLYLTGVTLCAEAKRTGMQRHVNAVSLVMLIAATVILDGCTSKPDVIAPFSKTTVTLTPQRFPRQPDGMIYHLWAQKTSGESRSIGRFKWDQTLYQFQDANGSVRSGVFSANFNILEYTFLSIAVEPNTLTPPISPGSVMLRDTIRAPEVKGILRLRFPVDLVGNGLIKAFCSIETPSDGDMFSSDYSGVWFGSYSTRVESVRDTLEVVRNRSQSGNIKRTSPILSTLDTIGLESSVHHVLRRFTSYGLDTLSYQTVDPVYKVVPRTLADSNIFYRFGSGIHTDSVDYFDSDTSDYQLRLTYTAPPVRETVHDVFTSGFDELPSLVGTGWHYKGWVLSQVDGVTSAPATFVRMNIGENKEINWEKPGRALFTTGVFYSNHIETTLVGYDTVVRLGDTSLFPLFSYKGPEYGYHVAGPNTHPHSRSANVVPFPGEDFLESLDPVTPTGAAAYIFGPEGTDTAIVFIAVEPDNYADTTKNFPLIAFAVEVAPDPQNFAKGVHDLGMLGQAGFTFPFPDGRKGWPQVEVRLDLE